MPQNKFSPPTKKFLKHKHLNLSSIPDSIKTKSIYIEQTTFGPRPRDPSSPPKKKIEHVNVIMNRVVRAKCCLKPQRPEDFAVLTKAVGDGSQYIANPQQKAFRIRNKFLNNKFCQGVTEDFMSVQNLDRKIDSSIITTAACFERFEINDPLEQ